MVQLYAIAAAASAFDPHSRFVRFKTRRRDGFIEFDFAIGEPGLSVEMILPEAQYHEFCRTNKVAHVTPAQAAAIDRDKLKWSAPVDPNDI
jgi:phenol hydroxylase P0 protein